MFLFGEIPNWTMTLMLNEFSVFLNLKILYQGKVKQSPAKTFTKTQLSVACIDTTFNKYMWKAHPTILPFLTCMMVTEDNKLCPFVAPVNHNYLNGAKTLSIVHTMMGNFCHGDDSKDLHIEQMGTDACVVVGFNRKVRTPLYLFPSSLHVNTNELQNN